MPVGRDVTRQAGKGWPRLAAKVTAAAGISVSLVAAGLAVTALPAYANVVSATYTIGSPSGAVSGVTASPTAVSESAETSFTIKFQASADLSGSTASWISVTPSEDLYQAPTDVDFVDESGSGCVQSGTLGTGGSGTDAVTGITIELSSSCSVSAGSTVQVEFDAFAPSAPGTFDFAVTTSANGTPATSNSITIGTSVASLSAGSLAYGANTTYSISDISVQNATTAGTMLVLEALPTVGSESLTFYGGISGYTVTYAPSGGSATTDPVESAALGTNDTSITLTLATALATGDTLSIVATGTNPPATTTAVADEILVTPAGGTAEVTSSLTFGSSVSSVTVSPSVLSAGGTATYAITFRAASSVASGGDIYLKETVGPTNFSTVTGVLVEDTTQPWHFLASGATLSSGSATIPLQDAIVAGDSLVLTLETVTNPPSAMTVSDFSVSTSSDPVPADAPAYSIGSGESAGVTVSVNPSTAAAVATYSISGLVASGQLGAGSSTIDIDAPSGTVFPATAGYYSVADSTTPSGSGTVSTVTGGGSNDVTITVPGTINSGDDLSITVEDAINPSVASSSYTVGLVGDVTGPAASSLATFPNAGLSYPNGSLVSFSGTVYLMAGGHAFGVPTTADLTKLKKVDHATTIDAPSGTTAPTTKAPRPGTLLSTRVVTGKPTIYVVGTEGDLHGFATPAQFANDGYDPALVVTVPSLGKITIGAPAGSEGAAANAISTAADGAVVNSSGAYYVFAGGHAFGIATSAELQKIKKTDRAKVLSGSVSATLKTATVATGVLFSANGPVYLSYQGKLWPFSSMSELSSKGYGGTAAVPVPSTGGITLVSQ